MACFKVRGTVMGGSTDVTAKEKKKLGLGSQCLGSDCNMRHPEKEEVWPY